MNYRVCAKGSVNYIECLSAEPPISTEQDAVDLVGLCGENETNLLMLHDAALASDFFRLRTGVAGGILQKFIIYSIRSAAVLSEEHTNTGKFREMVLEANRGSQFRVFNNREEAEQWLVTS